MTKFSKLTEQLVERFTGYQPSWVREYGEPGYNEQPANGILLADWNKVPRYICDGLERRGYALEWEDEWIEAGETSKIYRCQPDCYGWTPYYVIRDDCEVIGGDEIEGDADLRAWYVDEYLLNDPTRANIFRGVNLSKLGFSQFNGGFETGWHPGQTDSPAKVLERIQREMPGHDVVFQIDNVGQFDSHWSAWTRRVDTGEEVLP